MKIYVVVVDYNMDEPQYQSTDIGGVFDNYDRAKSIREKIEEGLRNRDGMHTSFIRELTLNKPDNEYVTYR